MPGADSRALHPGNAGFDLGEVFFELGGVGAGVGLGTQEHGDGLGAQVDGTQGSKVGFVVVGALGFTEGFEVAGAGDADELDLGGEVGGGEFVEESLLAGLEDGGVKTVLAGVLIPKLAPAPPGAGIGDSRLRLLRQSALLAL
jgi:hypothetical protein